MDTTTRKKHGDQTMKLIPIEQLIPIPEGIAIPAELLQHASLFSLPHQVTLLTKVGFTKVFIHRDGGVLEVKMVRVIRDDEPLAQRFSAKAVARTMSTATGMVPMDEQQAARLPEVTFASWTLPKTVSWEFSMPRSTSGAQLLEAAQASDTFMRETTEQLLTEPMPTS